MLEEKLNYVTVPTMLHSVITLFMYSKITPKCTKILYPLMSMNDF